MSLPEPGRQPVGSDGPAGSDEPMVLRGRPTEEETAAVLAVLRLLRACPGGRDPERTGFAAGWRARRLASLSRPAPRARRTARS